LWGIGSKTAERLRVLGIRTCGELGRTPAASFKSEIGIYGEVLNGNGMGICNQGGARGSPGMRSPSGP